MDNDHWIDRTEYPFTSHYMEAPAGKLHYVDEGQGEPIVMVHGNPTWSFLYRHLITRLRGTHRCVAPDHLGFGLSDKPQDWGYLPHDHAANITALIETLDLHDVTLVVQDWGGPIGLCYAVNQPDNVARLVIINTWAWPVNQDPYYVAFSGFVGGPVGRTLIRRRNFFATSIMRQAFGDKAKLRPEAHAHYLQPLADPADRKGCYVFPRQIVAATPWLEQLWAQVPVLREKPVLIVWGMKDIAFREKELKQWEATFPHAEVVRLETVGHYVQEEAPDALGQALDAFLAQTTAGTNR